MGGFSWLLKERGGIIEINGWTFLIVEDVVRRAGGSVPAENIFFYCAPWTPQTAISGLTVRIRDIPLDEFSLDILVKAEDLDDDWVKSNGYVSCAGAAVGNVEQTEMKYFDDDDVVYESLLTALSDGDGHNVDRLIKEYDIVGLTQARRKLEF